MSRFLCIKIIGSSVKIFTDCIAGKVMFSQVCVIHFVHGGVSQNAMGQAGEGLVCIPACNWTGRGWCVSQGRERCESSGMHPCDYSDFPLSTISIVCLYSVLSRIRCTIANCNQCKYLYNLHSPESVMLGYCVLLERNWNIFDYDCFVFQLE